MKTVGIICEYSPFHNGHIYHIKQIKKLYPDATIIGILSGNFTQRGLPSVIDKWSKTEIALTYGVDLVVELPFVFATQSADIFARGSIALLKALHVDILVFGSEENNVEKLKELAHIQCKNKDYDNLVKEYLKKGMNYPTAMSQALETLHFSTVTLPNDLLGLSYIKEIIKQDAKIKPVTIQRTNHFHDQLSEDDIVSATRVRTALKQKEDITKFVPAETKKACEKQIFTSEDYMPYLFYQITSEQEKIARYQTVDEGVEHRIIKHILDVDSVEDLVQQIKTKRYTYNKIMRMLLHILVRFTKEEAKENTMPTYIRILGMNEKGIAYLNHVKKKCLLPMITSISQIKVPLLDIEYRSTCVYASILNPEKRRALIKREFQKKPMITKKQVPN